MAADVHPIALVADSTRDAADVLACFDDDGLDAGGSLQLKRCGQAGRTGPDDNRSTLPNRLTRKHCLNGNAAEIFAVACASLIHSGKEAKKRRRTRKRAGRIPALRFSIPMCCRILPECGLWVCFEPIHVRSPGPCVFLSFLRQKSAEKPSEALDAQHVQCSGCSKRGVDLQRLYVSSLPSLGALHNVELHGLTFLQALETT